MRLLAPLLALALLAGCRTPAPGAFLSPNAEAVIRAEVMTADRAFDAATAARGIEGWMAYMAPDAARFTMGGTAVRGTDAIRVLDAPLFTAPAVQLRWAPTDGGAFGDGRYAFTTGHARLVRRAPGGAEAVEWTGVSVSVWRREPDGRWLVVRDTGADG